MPSGKKNVQRTKGNTRPSSSGRSAQRLMQPGSGHELTLAKGSHLGLVGFGAAGKANQGDDIDSRFLDENCRMLLKKMTKKDATTRLKALQEFKTFCTNCTDDTLLSALPFWPRLFNKLCLDPERRIREATNVAHARIVDRVKKNLAPYLKNIIGYWLLAMNDTYAPAASAAQYAFETAFSPAKQTDVLIFCKEEIMELITEYLFSLTPQTLSDVEHISPDELEDNYQRIVTCTMLAFVTVLKQLPPPEHEKLLETYNRIVDNGQFWKFGNHKTFSIRGAWLKIITEFSRASSLNVVFNTHLGKLVTTVLSNLDESDPCVAFAAWEAILQIITTFNDCWKFINLKKTVLPKLWKTLKQGCFGNASVIGPFLLPFMSKLMERVEPSSLDKFYEEYFNNCREGLSTRSVRSSLAEFAALITAYMECLRYVMVQLVEINHSQASSLLTMHLFPVIESSLTSQTSFFQNAGTFNTSLTSLLRYIHHQSLTAQTRAGFLEIEKEFWRLLGDQVVPVVTDYEKPNSTVLENLSILLRCLAMCDRAASEIKSLKRIRFEEEPASQKCEVRTSCERSIDPLVTEADSPLNLFVIRCCVNGMTGYASNHRSLVHLKFVASVLTAYPCGWLLRELVDFDEKENMTDSDLSRRFYQEMIRNNIIQEERKEESCLIFSSLILITIHIMDERNVILRALKDVCTATNNVFLLEALTRQLRGTIASDLVYNDWLASGEFSETVMSFSRSLFNAVEKSQLERDATWRLLIQFITHSVLFGSICAEELTYFVLNQLFETALNRKSRHSIDDLDTVKMNWVSNEFESLLKLLTEYLDQNKRGNDSPSVHRIVFLLFKILCQAVLHDDFIENNWIEPLRKLLTDGTKSFVSGIEGNDQMKNEDLECLKKCADYVHGLLVNENTPLTVDQVEPFVNWLQLWLDSISSGNTNVKGTSWDIILAILPTDDEWMNLSERLYHKVSSDILFHLKWSPSILTVAEPNRNAVIKNNVVTALAKFSLLIIDSVLTPSSGERFFGQLLGLAAISGYCKIVQDSSRRSVENWMKLAQSQLWPNVMKTNVCKKLISRCLELAQTSHYVWIESVSVLLPTYKKLYSDVDDLISDETIRSSCRLMQACVPHKTLLNEEFCFAMMNELTTLRQQTSNTSATNDAFLKLRISLKNIKLNDEIKGDIITGLLKEAIELYQESSQTFETSCNIADQASVLNASSFVSLLAEAVLHFDGNITSDMWNRILITLGNLIKVCCESQTSTLPLEVQYLRCNVFSLLAVVSSKISYMEENESENGLVVEWREFFAERFFHPMINLFFSFSTKTELPNDYVLKSVIKCFENIPLSTVENNSLSPKLVSSWDENDTVTPIKIKYLLNSFCPLLLSENREFRLGAFMIVKRVTSAFPRYLQQGNLKDTVQDDDNVSSVNWYLPGAFVDVLKRASYAVNVILAEVPFGEQVELESDSTAYSVVHGYLLSASLLFSFIGSGPSEWKSRWANALRAFGTLNDLANHLFSILSVEDGFSKELTLIVEHPSRKDLENLACFVFMEAVRKLPVLVREWWNSLDRKAASLVDKITSRYVTPKIISKDFNAVTEVKKLDNLSLLARPNAREVVATYMVEEVSFELVVQLAENHPLGPVNIQCSRCVGVSKSQWNYWMLQLTTSITQRNGSILDALVLWKCHVDRMFEGVEECFVCYTILGAHFQLPKLGCSTCKKKFHSSCLFKWFNTSGRSTCPLCRSIF